MNFGEALQAVKEGKNAARSGWNGKGMFIFWGLASIWGNYAPGGAPMVDAAAHYRINYQSSGCLAMKTAQNEIQVGWLASQSDMLAEDWEILA